MDPFDLSIVNQNDCPKLGDDSQFNISIDPNTFSAKNIGGWVKKAGEKIGDGVETVISGGKNLYKKIRGDSSEREDPSRLTEKITEATWLP